MIADSKFFSVNVLCNDSRSQKQVPNVFALIGSGIQPYQIAPTLWLGSRVMLHSLVCKLSLNNI